jgi:hypothetical protein
VRLQFADKAGKILAQKETIIPAKSKESEPSFTGPNNPLLEFPFVGGPGPNHLGLLAQVQYPADWSGLLPNSSHSKQPIVLLQPSLRILETSTGNTVRVIGPHGFKGLNVTPGTRPLRNPDSRAPQHPNPGNRDKVGSPWPYASSPWLSRKTEFVTVCVFLVDPNIVRGTSVSCKGV